MEKNKVRQRWNDPEMSQLRDRILDAILEKRNLQEVGGILYWDGKIDFRGLQFPQPTAVGELRSYVIAQNAFKISGYTFENVDFSYSNLAYAHIEKTKIRSCLFEDTDLSYIQMDGVQIFDSIFLRSKFLDSYTRYSSERKDDGIIKGTSFTECDFKKFHMIAIKVENCLFKDCRFSETMLEARFSECQFIGKMEDTWFRGYPWRATKGLSLLDRLFMTKRDPKKRNRMINVDLSQAEFKGVFFQEGIDLATCIFPRQDDHFRVDNLVKVFNRVKEVISAEWESPYKENAFQAMDRFFFDDHKKGMDIDFIYSGFLISSFPQDFNDRFFGLIKEVNRQVKTE